MALSTNRWRSRAWSRSSIYKFYHTSERRYSTDAGTSTFAEHPSLTTKCPRRNQRASLQGANLSPERVAGARGWDFDERHRETNRKVTPLESGGAGLTWCTTQVLSMPKGSPPSSARCIFYLCVAHRQLLEGSCMASPAPLPAWKATYLVLANI